MDFGEIFLNLNFFAKILIASRKPASKLRRLAGIINSYIKTVV